LIESTDFNPIAAWRLFDPPQDTRKNLNCHNVMAAFRNLRLKFTMSDAKRVLLRFDDDRDGLLSFTDIRNIFSPNDPSISGAFKARLPDEGQRNAGMMHKTRESMRHILQQVVRVERHIESVKKKIQLRQNFDLDAAFQAIMRVNPTANDDCIAPDDFKQILRSHGLYLLDRDVSTLYGRYDKDMNGNIGFKDFASEMLTVAQNDHVRECQVLPGKQYSRKDMARELGGCHMFPGSIS
jgi:Ca2+-binding EF-hand superfamily protein